MIFPLAVKRLMTILNASAYEFMMHKQKIFKKLRKTKQKCYESGLLSNLFFHVVIINVILQVDQ